jgi:serine/threonine protein kinase
MIPSEKSSKTSLEAALFELLRAPLVQACEAIARGPFDRHVHGDLKPTNLFVTTGLGGRQVVKVLDFGISAREDTEQVASVTIANSVSAR